MKKVLIGIAIAIVGFSVAVFAYESKHHIEVPAQTNTQAVVTTKPKQVEPPREADLPLTRDNLLKLVNKERAKIGVAPLKIDERLNWSAQQKADDMAKYDYFDHYRDGVFIGQQYINQTGIVCATASENLSKAGAATDQSATGVVDGWVHSPSHYKAMIDPDYTLTGFGIKTYGTLRVSVVAEHFCQP